MVFQGFILYTQVQRWRIGRRMCPCAKFAPFVDFSYLVSHSFKMYDGKLFAEEQGKAPVTEILSF